MTRKEAIEELKAIQSCYSNREFEEKRLMKSEEEALCMAIVALSLLNVITDRPCSVCKHHKENGCSKWDCVFDGHIGGKK